MSRRAVRFFLILLRLLPRDFRQAHADGMEDAFRELLKSETRPRDLIQWAVFWVRVLQDILTQAAQTRQTKRQNRHARRYPQSLLSTMMTDIAHAVRGLVRSPGFTIVAIVSLAIGIGVNTSVFSLVNAVQFRPLPFSAPHDLFHVSEAEQDCRGCRIGMSYATYNDLAAANSVFSSVGAYRETEVAITETVLPITIAATRLTPSVIDILGVLPVAGRPMVSQDDQIGVPAVALVSQNFWVSRFGNDIDINGRTVSINGIEHAIIGVMPRSFEFPESSDLWLPLTASANRFDRHERNLQVIGRRLPGNELAVIDQDVASIVEGIATTDPAMAGKTANVLGYRDFMQDGISTVFWLLLGAASGVLLIACANIGGVLLARGLDRKREIAVRSALGASRGRLIRFLLAESLIIAVCGGTFGIAVAIANTKLAIATLPSAFPYWLHFAIDVRVLAFTAGVTLLTVVFVGLGPAINGTRISVQETLKDGNASTPVAESKTRAVFVTGQIAITLGLLMGTGVLVRTLLLEQNADPGYTPDDVYVTDLALIDVKYAESESRRAFVTSLLTELKQRSIIQFSAVAQYTYVASRATVNLDDDATPVGREQIPHVVYAVSPQYFEVLRLPLLRGRVVNTQDFRLNAPVAVINEEAARMMWNDEDPIGRRVRFDRVEDPRAGRSVTSGEWLTVVGLVNNVADGSPRRGPTAIVYTTALESPGHYVTLYARGAGSSSIAIDMEQAVHAVDATQPVDRPIPLAMDTMWSPTRAMSALLGGLALLALFMAALGIYAMMANSVARRTREFGVHMALGATGMRIRTLVLRKLGTVLLIGTVTGAMLSFGLTAVLQSLIPTVGSISVPLLLGIAAIFAFVATAATFAPLQKATAVDPASALRYE